MSNSKPAARPTAPVELLIEQRLIEAIRDETRALYGPTLNSPESPEFERGLSGAHYNTPFSNFVPSFDSTKLGALRKYLAARFDVKLPNRRSERITPEEYTFGQAVDDLRTAAGVA